MNGTLPARTVLRDLPLAARLTLAAFLISVGVGYFSALVQLHFQHASPGNPLPTKEDVVKHFSGEAGARPLSKFELLLEASENLPFNGSGQMSEAFTTKSGGWSSAVRKKARKMGGDEGAAAKALHEERDTERLAVLEWIRAGAGKQDYAKDRFALSGALAQKPISEDYVVAEGAPAAGRVVKIQSILTDRCVRCHNAEAPEDAKAGDYPLENYDQLKPYLTAKASASVVSLTKLAQTTHVHLLGFAMLYGLTGLILAFSSYPATLRVLLCPLPLVAQVVDISFWWLARLEAPLGPQFADAIRYSGAVVAVGLFLHIVLGLFNLFGRWGKLVLILLLAGSAWGGYVAKERVFDPYLANETARPVEAP